MIIFKWRGDIVTCTRATSKIVSCREGFLRTTPPNVPAVEWAPPSVGELGPDLIYSPYGALLEGETENLFTQSGDFSDPAWAKIGTATATANYLPLNAPDQSKKSALLSFPAIGDSVEQQVLGLSGSPFLSHTVFIRAATPDDENKPIELETWSDAFGYTPGDVTEHVTKKWKRAWTNAQLGATETSVTVRIVRREGSTPLNILACLPQFEVGHVSSYVPTGAATATRAADHMEINSTQWANYRGGREGTLYVEARSGVDPTQDAARVVSLSSSTDTDNYIALLRHDGDAIFRVVDGGVTVVDAIIGAWPKEDSVRLAATWAENSFAASIDGGTPVTSASGTIPVTDTVYFGHGQDGGNPFDGHLLVCKYDPRRTPDGELNNLGGD